MNKPTVSSVTDSYIVAFGNTYPHNDKFRQFGFTLKNLGGTWYWYRNTLTDKLWYWEQTLLGWDKEILTVYTTTLDPKVLSDAKRDIIQMTRESKPVAPHALDNSVFEVTAWYAKAFKENNNTAYAFRNLKVLKVHAESAKAYQVDVEYFAGIACSCGVCGRELNNAISKATGIGPICAEKIGMPRPTMETAKEIVAQLEAKSKEQGTFAKVWIPKSQIKQILEKQREAA